MTTIKWTGYLKWRETKGLNNADVMIYVGNPDLVVEVKSKPIIVDGESLVQIQIGRANFLVPFRMVDNTK